MDGSFLRLVWNAGQRLSRSATVALVLAGLVPAVAPGQQEEGPPRPFIVSEGPVGAVQALTFSPDSRLLYAAGLDKVVHLWNLTPDERGQDRAAYVRELRWEISRGTRGVLLAAAISPDGTLLAGGGMSARDAGGNLVLWDAGRGEIVQSLPRVLPTPDQLPNAVGHVRGQTIQSLDFSPDGGRLASVDTFGEAWLWTHVGNDWAGTRIVGAGPPTDGRLQLSWIDRDHVAIPDSSPGDNARAHVWRVAGQPGKVAQTLEHVHGVRSLASHPASGRWATADGAGRVFVWDQTRLQAPVVQLGAREPVERGAAYDLSFLDRDRLLVLRERRLADERSKVPLTVVDARVELWDIPTGRLIDERVLSSDFDAAACTTSPDGRWIAVHSPQQDSILLFRVNPAALPEQKPLSGNPALVLSSRGVHASAVAFERTAKGQPRRLGLTRSLNRDPKANFEPNARFDLESLELSPVPQPLPAYVSPDEFRGGWAVKDFVYEFTAGVRKSEVQLVHPVQGLVRIELDPVKQRKPISYCFIPDAAGQPYAIAIGTDYEFGIYVYRLPMAGAPRPELIRYFRDHTGGVSSLGVSPDGQLLASCATDQTVKIWSLKHLIRGQNPFVRAPAWGADFQFRNGQVVVTAVQPEGIAAARQIQVGDVVTELFWTEGPQTLGSQRPDEIFAVLSGVRDGNRVELWESHLLTVRRGGRGEPGRLPIVVPAWEPLATLFVDRHEEWVLFTPAGFFQASPAEGADLLGWQVNRGAGFTPRVANAQELRRELERPARIKATFVSFEPPAIQLPVAAALKGTPELNIESPQLTGVLPHGQPKEMEASVKLPGVQTLDDYDFEVFMNSQLMKPAAELVAPGHVRLTWTAKGSRTLNDIRIRAFQREGGRLRLIGESPKFKIASDKVGAIPLPPMRIHLVTIACQEYTGKQVPKLNFTVSDAKRLKAALAEASQHSLSRFTIGRTYHLENGEVSATSVQSLLASVAKDLLQDRATEDDLLVIGLTGHGMEVDDDFYFLPLSIQDAASDDALKANAKKVGITWEHILNPIAALGCRKLLIVDACQSGGLAQPEGPIYRQTQGPVYRDARNQSVLVMTASSENESALEDASFGGGLFTDSLVAGLKSGDDGAYLQADGYLLELQEDETIRAFKSSFGTVSSRAEKNRDNILTLSELAVFASMRVKKQTAEQQNPCFATTRRLREDEVYLTESNDGSTTGTSATTAPSDR